MSIATGPWRLYNVPTGCQPKQPSHTPMGCLHFWPIQRYFISLGLSHQSFMAVSLAPPSLGPVLAELPGVNQNRQHHSGLLYQQVGGHTPSCCCSICLMNFMWLQTQKIVLQARHIPGCYTVIPDRLSWLHQPAYTEWRRVLDLVFESVGSPTVKMFATVQNYASPCLLFQTTVLWQ